MKDYINIEIELNDIKKLLKKSLIGPNVDIIADVVIGNLSKSHHGYKHLYKALNGISSDVKLKVGTSVLINKDRIYNSSVDWDKMESENMIHQGFIKACITNIDIYDYYPVEITMKIINKEGELVDYKTSIEEKHLNIGEEWP